MTMKCTNCGKEIGDASKFCPYCGANLNDVKEVVKPEAVSGDGSKQADSNKTSAPASTTSEKHSTAWTLALLSIILGAVGTGFVGLILGIIALCSKPNETEKTMAIVGIVISCCLGWVWWGFKIWVR
jgi:uncharacterized membrane protein YvbJ